MLLKSKIIISVVAGEDFMIINNTFVITPEVSQACLQFVAIDDTIVESDEELTLTIAAEDVTVGNVTIAIIDNDGM